MSEATSAPAPAPERTDWLESPTPLVALLGLQQIHQPIISNLPQKNLLRFLSLPIDHSFPKRKQHSHRNTPPYYDGYQPDGIVKSTWLTKHIDVIPAVAALLFEWDEAASGGTPTSTATLVNWEHGVVNSVMNFKRENAAREMRILVVVVHHHGTTQEDESWINDKLHAVARLAGLDNKSIFLLTTVDLKSALRKLEDRLYEMCCDYYKAAGKRVKKLKDKINKNIQLKLLIRHQFKVAFFSELAGDTSGAQKYYLQSYASLYLWAQKCVGDRLAHLEIRLVAYLLCFKMIKIMLSMGKVSEAIEQFEQHIVRYGEPTESGLDLRGPPELEFTHAAWMAKQFRTFGELLEQNPSAVAQMKVSRHRNPGFYFQTAAACAAQRKAAAIKAGLPLRTRLGHMGNHDGRSDDEIPPAVPPVVHSVYIGQIDLGEEGVRLHIAERTRQVVELLRGAETQFDHSQQIIDLLTRAYEHFKQQRSNRMILHIAALMASEYLSSGNHTMAKKFFDRIAKTYRREGWWSVLTDIVRHAHVCAQRLGSSRDEIEYALELMGTSLRSSPNEKREMQLQLTQILQRLAQQSASQSDAERAASGAGAEDVEGSQTAVASSTSSTSLTSPTASGDTASALSKEKSGGPLGLEAGVCGVFNVGPEIGLMAVSGCFSPVKSEAALPKPLAGASAGSEASVPLTSSSGLGYLQFGNAGNAEGADPSSSVVSMGGSTDTPSVTPVHNNEPVLFSVTVCSHFPLPVKLLKLVIVFNQKAYTTVIAPHTQGHQYANNPQIPNLLGVAESSMVFNSEESRTFHLVLPASIGSLARPLLRCTNAYLYVSLQPQEGAFPVPSPAISPALLLKTQCVTTHSPLFRKPVPPSQDPDEYKASAASGHVRWLRYGEHEQFACSQQFGEVRITAVVPKSSVSVDHRPPLLPQEYYPLQITVRTNEDVVVDGQLTVAVARPQSDSLQSPRGKDKGEKDSSVSFFSAAPQPRPLDAASIPNTFLIADLPRVEPGSVLSHTVLIRAAEVGTGSRNFSISLRYRTPSGVDQLVEQLLTVPVIAPFSLHFRAFATYTPVTHKLVSLMDSDTRLRSASQIGITPSQAPPTPSSKSKDAVFLAHKPFVVHVEVENVSSHDLLLHSLSLDVGPAFENLSVPQGIESAGGPDETSPHTTKMRPGDRQSAAFDLLPKKQGVLVPGHIAIRWARPNSLFTSSTEPSAFVHAIPSYTIAITPLDVKVEYPPLCEISQTFLMSIELVNHTIYPQDIRISVPSSQPAAAAGLPAVNPSYFGASPSTPTHASTALLTASNSQQLSSPALAAYYSPTPTSSNPPPPAGPPPNSSAAPSSTSAVCFSGCTNGTLRLLPHSAHRLVYKLAALDCGFVKLPQLLIQLAVKKKLTTAESSDSSSAAAETLVALVEPFDFGSVFVRPRESSVMLRRQSAMVSKTQLQTPF